MSNNCRLNTIKRTLERFLSSTVHHLLSNFGTVGCPRYKAHGISFTSIVLSPSKVKYTVSSFTFWQLGAEIFPLGILLVFFALFTNAVQSNYFGSVHFINFKDNVLNLGAGEFLVGFAGFVCGLDSGLNNKKESGGAGVKRNEKVGLEKKDTLRESKFEENGKK